MKWLAGECNEKMVKPSFFFLGSSGFWLAALVCKKYFIGLNFSFQTCLYVLFFDWLPKTRG
jgi:hypothetical protein